MLSKCANPSCSTQLIYLREGTVFRMESAPQAETLSGKQAPRVKSVKRVEHFWLCGACSVNLTLEPDSQHGVKIVPKKFRALAAAS